MLAVVYSLVALGLALIYSVMRIANFAHGEFYTMGGYVIYYFYTLHGVNFAAALLLSIACLAVVGVLVEKAVFKPIRDFHFPQLIVSLGLSMLIQGALTIGFGGDDKGVARPFQGVVRFAGASIAQQRLMIVPIAIGLIVALFAFVKWSKPGRAMRAIAQAPVAAALTGVDINRISSLAFAIGVALAGAAGALMVPIFSVNPFAGGVPTMKAFTIICIGGLGSIPGAVLGGLILGLVDSFGATLLGGPPSTVITFVMLILVLILRPRGLLGHA